MLTARILGVAINPHLFRDCAATTIATDDPEHVLIIANNTWPHHSKNSRKSLQSRARARGQPTLSVEY
jgi:hypothetical protein